MIERRAGLELRAADAGRRLEGYIAKWNVEARINDTFSEIVRPGAFSASLADGSDILGLMDHDPARLLARTGNGTLRLVEDSVGLAFSLDLPDTTCGRDARELARLGSLGGCSFGFTLPPGGDQWPAPDKRELRTVMLRECSVVSSWPAYSGTEVFARHQQPRQPSAAALLRRRWLATL